MQPIQQPAAPQTLDQHFAQAASDGSISSREARQLNQYIDSTNLSPEDKDAMKAMVDEISDASSWQFLFFGGKSKITSSEMQGLQQLAQTNSRAAGLLNGFTQALQAQSQARAPRDGSQARTPDRANFDPVQSAGRRGGIFGGRSPGGSSPVTGGQATSAVGNLRAGGPTPSWTVTQNTGRASSGGDCGPASAAMILRRFGFMTGHSSSDAIGAVRSEVGLTSARQGPNGSYWALGEDEVARAIEGASNGAVQETYRSEKYRGDGGDRNTLINDLRNRIAQGDQPILLTGSPSTSSRHYTVVTEVKDDGTLVMVDPGGQGYVREVTPAQLQALMDKADNRTGSVVMSFNRR